MFEELETARSEDPSGPSCDAGKVLRDSRSLPRYLGAFLALSLYGCSKEVPEAPQAPDPVQALSRSLHIVSSATQSQPKVLRVLFYGQSISKPNWTDQAVSELKRAYPNVAFDVRNLALGGFAANLLETTAERDLASFQPDLIVFHVYGDHRAYERIIRMIRSRTAADVVVQTDHVVTPVEPVCDIGVQFRWSPPPGCTGHVRFSQRHWEDYMSGFWIPYMAAHYNLAVEPRRARWDAYLRRNQLPPEALLADAPHPNEAGYRLMARMFASWFESLATQAARRPPPTGPAISSLRAPPVTKMVEFGFDGSRAELVAEGPLAGAVEVRVDGKPQTDLDGCWQDSRVSRLSNMPDWPAIARVFVDPSYHRADRWTVSLSELNPAQDEFKFRLSSQAGGADGEGQATESFVSDSGRVRIEPGDWVLAYARRTSGRPIAEGATFSWERRFVCSDEEPIDLPGGDRQWRYVLATGLPTGPHRLQIRVRQNAPKISEVRVFRPPLQP